MLLELLICGKTRWAGECGDSGGILMHAHAWSWHWRDSRVFVLLHSLVGPQPGTSQTKYLSHSYAPPKYICYNF